MHEMHFPCHNPSLDASGCHNMGNRDLNSLHHSDKRKASTLDMDKRRMHEQSSVFIMETDSEHDMCQDLPAYASAYKYQFHSPLPSPKTMAKNGITLGSPWVEADHAPDNQDKAFDMQKQEHHYVVPHLVNATSPAVTVSAADAPAQQFFIRMSIKRDSWAVDPSSTVMDPSPSKRVRFSGLRSEA